MNDKKPELDLLYIKKMKKTLSKGKKYLKKTIKSYVEYIEEKKECNKDGSNTRKN